MLIVCPHCTKSYDVAPASLGETGRPVRCMGCRTTFFAEAPRPALQSASQQTADSIPDAFTQAPAGDGTDEFDAAEMDDAAVADAWAAAEAEEAAQHAAAGARDDEAAYDMQALIDGPSIVPPEEEQPRFREGKGPFPMTGGDIEIFAAKRARKKAKKQFKFPLPKLHWPLSAMPTALLALGTIVVVLIGWRTQIVRLAPQTASLYSTIGLGVNLRGLEFENITISREMHEGIPILAVAGEIVSVTGRSVEVPRLRLAVRNQRGNEIYSWTAMPPQSFAAPGETLTFRSRLASPPTDAYDVVVRFQSRRDATAALR